MLNLHDARTSGGALSFQHLDICTTEVVDVAVRRRPDVIFHLANSTTASSSIARPSEDVTVTLLGTLQVLAGALAASVTKVVVAIRAADFYGAFARGGKATTEDQRGQLCSPHGASSRALLDYLAFYRERDGIDFAALLIGEVYGPREHSGRTGAVRTFIDQLRAGAPGTIPGDGRSIRDFIFIDDVVDALSRAATNGSGRAYNVGTGVGTSLSDLRALIAEQLGIDRPAIFGDWPEGEVHESVLDAHAASALLGWEAWTGLRDGIDQVIAASMDDEAGMDRGAR
jgi:UDP-glucose 4-epimerase